METKVYRRRSPGKSIIRQVVKENLDEFVALADWRGRGLPKYVKQASRRQ